MKYAPDGFLNEDQKAAKQKALRRQAKEYAAYTIDGARNFNVEEQSNEETETQEATDQEDNGDSRGAIGKDGVRTVEARDAEYCQSRGGG